MEVYRKALKFYNRKWDDLMRIKIFQNVVIKLDKWYPHLARFLICAYFLNWSLTAIGWYVQGYSNFPLLAVPLLLCTLPVIANKKVYIFAWFLLFIATKDALEILSSQLTKWWSLGQPLYINELMVKKFSMLGCVFLVLVNDPFFKERIDGGVKALAGLVSSDQPKYNITTRMSIVLLAARLLISSLLIFVGYGEISRQIQLSSGIDHGGHVHTRPAGDGHNNMWPKLMEFSLVPFLMIGLGTRFSSRLLALILISEALTYWRWWDTQLGEFYAVHARDHFTVNVAVGGGLLLLQGLGGGKYSVDELLKKKE